MEDEQTRTFVRVIADIDTAMELQRTEIDDIRRELAEWSAKLQAATNARERDVTMLAFANYMAADMGPRLVGPVQEAQCRILAVLQARQGAVEPHPEYSLVGRAVYKLNTGRLKRPAPLVNRSKPCASTLEDAAYGR